MSWWKKLLSIKSPQQITRELRVHSFKEEEVPAVLTSTHRPLNTKDIEIIKRLEKELLKAGVLEPIHIEEEEGSSDFLVEDRIEDILQAVYEQGLDNVKDLVGDFDLDNYIISTGKDLGENPMLEVDDLDSVVYGTYKDSDNRSSQVSVKTDQSNGSVAFRLSDGTTLFGKIPNQNE